MKKYITNKNAFYLGFAPIIWLLPISIFFIPFVADFFYGSPFAVIFQFFGFGLLDIFPILLGLSMLLVFYFLFKKGVRKYSAYLFASNLTSAVLGVMILNSGVVGMIG
jgi:hypothetical protein